MQFVVVLDISDELLDGVDSIESACSRANAYLREGFSFREEHPSVRPLSEVIAC